MSLISFSCYIALAGTSRVGLIDAGGTDILVSFLILGETFTTKCNTCSRLFADAPYQVKMFPFIVF